LSKILLIRELESAMKLPQQARSQVQLGNEKQAIGHSSSEASLPVVPLLRADPGNK